MLIGDVYAYMSEESPELAVSEESLESFLPLLGLEVTEDERIRDIETGEIMTNEDGEELTVDEIGYLGHDDEEGGVVLVEDDLPSIVDHLSDREFREDWEDPRE